MSVGHRRSISSSSSRKGGSTTIGCPIPPPRSLPTTFRRRKNVGDRVFVSSPTKVYFDFVDDNSKLIEEQSGVEEQKQKTDVEIEKIEQAIRNSKDIPKLRNRIFEESLESQEICFYIGNNSSIPVWISNHDTPM